MNQYLLQKYNQIIDIYENINPKNNISLTMTASAPFMYTFMSKEQLDVSNISTVILMEGKDVSKIISSSQRYLIISSPTPSVLHLSRTVSTKSAELFDSTVIPWWGWLIVAASILFVIVLLWTIVFFLVFSNKKHGIKSPLSTLVEAIKAPAGADGKSKSPASQAFSQFRKNKYMSLFKSAAEPTNKKQ